LRSILGGLGVPERSIVLELAAVEAAPFARNTDQGLVVSLSDLQFYCEIELAYHDDLHTVQMNLSDIPHPNRAPYHVPAAAIRSLFSEAASARPLGN
jgi:hypothetical protein